MRNHRIGSVVALSLLLAVVSGCASPEEQAYKRARMTDTVVAWEDFLRHYPAGEETAKARQRLAELHEDHEWQRAGLANTVAAYHVYLRGYPQGRFANEALVRIANLNLQDVPDHEPTPEELRAAAAARVPAPVSAAPPERSRGPTALIRRDRPASLPSQPAPKPTLPKPTLPKPTLPKPTLPKPAPAKPTPPKAAAPKAVPAKPAPPAAASPGDWVIQLGAFSKGEAAAQTHWQKLQRAVPALSGLTPEVVAPGDGKPFHRLRVAGLARERAKALCESIRVAGEGCLVTAP